MTNQQIFLFLIRVLFLFIIFLLIFYQLSPFLLPVLAKAVETVLIELFPQIIESIRLHNTSFEVITHLPIANIPEAILAFDINPLKYAYGFPLFLALSFSNKGRISDKFFTMVIAYLLTLIAQIWGLGFDIIRHLIFEFGGQYAVYFGFSNLLKNFISLGSQFGFLLLPSLVPILLWTYLEKDFVQTKLLSQS